jgi:hypothetical protein
MWFDPSFLPLSGGGVGGGGKLSKPALASSFLPFSGGGAGGG